MHVAKSQQKDEDLFRAILNALPNPFSEIDVQDYSVVLANSAAGIEPTSPPATCHGATHKSLVPCTGVDHLCTLKLISKTKYPGFFWAEYKQYRNNLTNKRRSI